MHTHCFSIGREKLASSRKDYFLWAWWTGSLCLFHTHTLCFLRVGRVQVPWADTRTHTYIHTHTHTFCSIFRDYDGKVHSLSHPLFSSCSQIDTFSGLLRNNTVFCLHLFFIRFLKLGNRFLSWNIPWVKCNHHARYRLHRFSGFVSRETEPLLYCRDILKRE